MANKKKRPTVRPRIRPGQKSKTAIVNNYLKFKTPEERLAVFNKYCEHLERGYSRESFPELSYEAMEEYVSKFPDELDAEKMHESWRNGRKLWETMGMQGTMGHKYKNFKSTAYVFIMQNMYGMKQRVDVTGKTSQDVKHTIVELALPDNERAYKTDE